MGSSNKWHYMNTSVDKFEGSESLKKKRNDQLFSFVEHILTLPR